MNMIYTYFLVVVFSPNAQTQWTNLPHLSQSTQKIISEDNDLTKILVRLLPDFAQSAMCSGVMNMIKS